MEDWDEDLQMWQLREEPSTDEELEREYEQHLVHSQAAGVAQAVHEEMEIMRDAWQASHPKPPEQAMWSHGPARDWVASGYDLVHEIYRQQLLQHRRDRVTAHGEEREGDAKGLQRSGRVDRSRGSHVSVGK